jgi:hypothetical protein
MAFALVPGPVVNAVAVRRDEQVSKACEKILGL